MVNRIRAAALLAALYLARRYYRNWGATKAECRARLPGDELVGDPVMQTTEATSVDAAPAAVWPWLVQLGADRGGFYLSELAGRLVGLRFGNADRVHSGWQQLAVGDTVRVAPNGWLGRREGLTFTVAEILPQQRLVLHTSGAGLPWDTVWSFHLLPALDDRTRLLVRTRSGLRHPGEVLALEMARPLVTLGLRAMLRGIKRRALSTSPG